MARLFYLFFILLFTIYSFAHTDPNLIYSHHPVFLNFQSKLWGIGLENRLLSSFIYTGIVSGLFIAYITLIKQIKNQIISRQLAWKIVYISIIILIFANPALSHDIFNYIFNAKMVIVYGADPHIQTALNFASDSWTRYMHNIHTPAPYGYGWTAISMIPYFLGFGNFKLTLLLFKLLIVGAFIVTLIFQTKLQKLLDLKNNNYLVFLFALNPLVLIESFANGHNDLVMMAGAVIAVYTFARFQQSKNNVWIVLSLLAFTLSASIKYATVSLAGMISLVFFQNKLNIKQVVGPLLAACMFLPLLTVRSQQFLPWYLIWPLTFLPIITNRYAQIILISFSASSLLRYVPVIYLPMFDRPTSETSLRIIEVSITFLVPVLFISINWLIAHIRPSHK